FSASPNLQIQPFGKCVDDGNTDTVQSTRNFVRGVIKLPSGMQFRQNDFRSRLTFLRHDFSGYTSAVVNDSDRVVNVDDDMGFRTEAGERFVNRIVDDFI